MFDTKNTKKIVTLILLVAVITGSTENTKLCDFTSYNNNDFICTPISPPTTSTPSFEIKPALLNLVMKDQFSGVGEDVALLNFVELCNAKVQGSRWRHRQAEAFFLSP